MATARRVTVRQATRDELAAVRTLRLEELEGDRPLPQPVESTAEDLSPESVHIAAFMGNQIVGVARVNPLPGNSNTFLVTRVAIRKEYRRQGIGAQVMRAAEDAARGKGAKTVVLDSRPEAESFYARLGYMRSMDRKPEFDAHISMIKFI